MILSGLRSGGRPQNGRAMSGTVGIRLGGADRRHLDRTRDDGIASECTHPGVARRAPCSARRSGPDAYGDAVLEAGALVPIVGAGASNCTTSHWAITAQTKIIAQMAITRDLLMTRALTDGLPGRLRLT
jgi:hypothetical protein